MAALQNKRKRDAGDIAGGRAAPGMQQTGNEFEQHYLQDDDGMDNTLDFAAALAAQHGTDPGDGANHQGAGQMQVQGGNGQSASDTAAAAIAQFHTMTVPPSTEQSFITQPTAEQGGSSAQRRASNFNDVDTSAVQSSPNGDTSPTGLGVSADLLGGRGKPPVGSDEWHKVRKDNHKEGNVHIQVSSIAV